MRLDPWLRRALYAALAALTATAGSSWLAADWGKATTSTPTRGKASRPTALLMLHGGTAMVSAHLPLLGALVPLHVRRAWRSGRNRLTGPAMVAINAVLIATAFGLYYAGSDMLRHWISDVHIAIGLALPAGLVLHVWLGRRSAPARGASQLTS